MSYEHDSELEARISSALVDRARSLPHRSASSEYLRDVRHAASGAPRASDRDSWSPPSVELPSVASEHEPQLLRRRRAGLVGAIAVLAVIALVIVTNNHPVSHGSVRVASSSSTTTMPAALSCPVNGLTPSGKTYGTTPWAPGATGAIPDYLAVGVGADRRIVGYMEFPGPSDGAVYGCDFKTVVGHVVDGKGFIPLGVDPASVPYIDPQGVANAKTCFQQHKPLSC